MSNDPGDSCRLRDIDNTVGENMGWLCGCWYASCLFYRFSHQWLYHSTHWGWVTHICISILTDYIGLDNGLLPGQCQAIIWTDAGILLIRTLGTTFSEILSQIHTLSFRKMHLKMSSVKCRPFCLGLSVLNAKCQTIMSAYCYHLSYILQIMNGTPGVIHIMFSAGPSVSHI